MGSRVYHQVPTILEEGLQQTRPNERWELDWRLVQNHFWPARLRTEWHFRFFLVWSCDFIPYDRTKYWGVWGLRRHLVRHPWWASSDQACRQNWGLEDENCRGAKAKAKCLRRQQEWHLIHRKLSYEERCRGAWVAEQFQAHWQHDQVGSAEAALQVIHERVKDWKSRA